MNEIFTFQKIFRAYLDCRKNKRKTINALKFEWDFERNLFSLLRELKQKTYKTGRSICFAVDKPTLREIFAATFRDRIVHHLLVNELLAFGERIFIFDSYSCRKNKGTHKAVKRLKNFISQETYYLQLDISGFFMSIDQNILYSILEKLVLKQKRSGFWKEDLLWLAKTIIFSRPTENYMFKGSLSLFESIPERKSLFYAPKNQGLPIGNYSSQFFANLYLNELDQFIKRRLKCRHYVRYVDDLILLSNDKRQLRDWGASIETFLKENLNMKINAAKTKIQPLENGVDFLGYLIKPKYTLVRKKVVKRLKEKLGSFNSLSLSHKNKILSTVNSYFGHFRHANSFNLRKHVFKNHLGKLKTNFHQKANFSSLKIARVCLRLFFCFAIFNLISVSKAYAATYYSTGTVVSTNLLWGQTVKTIDAFGYNASSIPTNTTLKVQFSQNGFTWKNSSGTVDGWDTMSQGDNTAQGNAINLSGLGWGNDYFYYKVQFDTTDTSVTAVLDSVIVYYTPGVPSGTYYATGTVTSTNILAGLSVKTIDKFGYNISSLPTGATLKIQFSQNNFTWKNSSGVTDGWDTLSAGDHLAEGDALNISGLAWGGGYFYYKIQFDTTDTSVTPTLDSIQVYYSTGTPVGTYYPSGTITSNNLLSGLSVKSIDEFEATLSAKPVGTTATVQFSQDNTNWYNSSAVLGQSNTLNAGSNDIVLQKLHWSGANFYYKIQFTTTDTSTTPVLSNINLITNSYPLVPIAYWKFDEGNGTGAAGAHNSGGAGSALNGTLSGATKPAWTNSGKFGKALTFNGTSAYIAMPTDASALKITSDISLSAWINLTNTSSQHDIICKYTGTASTSAYCLNVSSAGKLVMQVVNATGPAIVTTTGTKTLSSSTWYHVLGVLNTTTGSVDLYVNGVLDKHNTTSIPTTLQNPTTILDIGAENAGSNLFAGTIDEVKVYPYALSSGEVKTDYNRGASEVLGAAGTNSTYQPQAANQEYCVPGDATSCAAPVGRWDFEEGKNGTCSGSKDVCDTSGSGNDGTWNGTGTHWSTGKVGKGGKFNGSDDYTSVANSTSIQNLPNGDFTAEGWFFPKTLISSYGGFFGKGSWGVRGWGVLFALTDSSHGTINLRVEFGTTSLSYATSSTFNLNSWDHISIVYLSATKTAKIYINGKEAAYSASTAGSGSLISDSGDTFNIGVNNSTGSRLNGLADNVRVYNYARSAAQIAWDYNRGAPVAWWKFDECSGLVAHDSIGTNNGTITIGTGAGTGHQDSVGTCTDGTGNTAWNNGKTGKRNASLNFDGIDDKVTAPTISGIQSVAFWVKPASNTASIMDIRTAATAAYISASSGAVSATGFTSPTIYVNGVSGGTLTGGAWNHVVITSGTAVTGSAISFGLANGTYLNGQIDDVEIWNYALTATQVKNVYNCNSAVCYAPVAGAPSP